MNTKPNNYTLEVIEASKDLILADRSFNDFSPQNFKQLKENFNTAKKLFKEASNYLFMMRETDDESLLKQAREILSNQNQFEIDDDEERNDFRSFHIDTNK
jgi:hypothetical protein